MNKRLCTESNKPTASSDSEGYSGILGGNSVNEVIASSDIEGTLDADIINRCPKTVYLLLKC